MTRFAPARLILPALLATLLLTGCGADQPAQDAAPARVMTAAVETLSLSSVADVHAAPATVVAERRVQVASRLMGHIRTLEVVEGARVAQGQRLFSIDPVDIQGQVETARAGLQQAEDAQRDARLEYDRFSALLKEDAVTRQQYEKVRLQLDLASARVAQARAALTSASHQMRYATVTAPFAGVVTQRLAQAGDLATPGQPVLILEDPGALQLQTHVPQTIFVGLKPGMVVQVEVDGLAAPIQARVARLSPAADPVSRLFLVKLDAAAAGLKSGLFARVLFPLGTRQALLVPASALIRRAGIDGVFVVNAQGLAEFRMVRTGAVIDGRAEVQAGLSAGERVVTEGAQRLETGDQINPKS